VNPIVGTFHSADAESLLFVPDSGPGAIAVSLQDISSFEIGRGRPRRTWWGALGGAVVFGAVGAYLGSLEAEGSDSPGYEAYPAGVAIAFAIPGAGLGALAGAFIRGDERWERVEPDRIRQGSE
jgi:hypothetical protein